MLSQTGTYDTLSWVMVALLAVLLVLSLVIGLKIYRLWQARKQGRAGTKLQTRMVLIFGLVSLVPTLLVALFSVLFFNLGIQNWFNTKVSTALDSSLLAAEGYLIEHKNNIRGDALAMANDINRQAAILRSSPARLKKSIGTQALLRELSEAAVFQQKEDNITEQFYTIPLDSLENRTIPASMLHQAFRGEVAVLNQGTDRVRALIKLEALGDTYLLVGRRVDENVLQFYTQAQNSVSEYNRLRGNINQLQLQFLAIFLAVSLLLLLATIWAGLRFAGRFTSPISHLVEATSALKEGKLDARAPHNAHDDEMGVLTRAFNRMADELQHNQASLLHQKNFMEQVLAEISTGVLVLDPQHRINVANAKAVHILGKADVQHQNLSDVWPQWQEMQHETPAFKQLKLVRDRQQRTVLVHQVAMDKTSRLITLDDITDLQAAERNAAWSDVARRVAHEIKNPLTPMQLSAERLAKKYSKTVPESEQEKFSQYTQTILRHIETVRHIVDAFAYFAKLPTPEMKQTDLIPLIKTVVFSEQVTHPQVTYHLPKQTTCLVMADKQQVQQMLQNLLKNAAESMEMHHAEAAHIYVQLHQDGASETLTVRDTGPGFSEVILQEGITPYRTEKAQGTGLGLAIVEKIVKEHGGQLTLENHKQGGAVVRVQFPLASSA